MMRASCLLPLLAIAKWTTVDTESIDAELRDGILQLTFKKKAEAQPRKISVKGA